MSYLSRKVALQKWLHSGNNLAKNEISADAVTADLRTVNNTLSFWKLVGGTPKVEAQKTVLALATVAERIDRMDVTWVTEKSFSAYGISIKPSIGKTPVSSLNNNHIDLLKLDIDRLSGVARIIATALSQGQYFRFTKLEVIQIITRAIKSSLLSVDDLNPEVKKEIEVRIGS